MVESSCATLEEAAGQSPQLRVVAGAPCSHVTLVATIETYGLSTNVTVSLVRLTNLSLSFTAYPSSANNRLVPVTQLGRLPCSTNGFANAVAALQGTLSDATEVQYELTPHMTLASSNTSALVHRGGGRVAAPAHDTSAYMTATFGDRQVRRESSHSQSSHSQSPTAPTHRACAGP